MISSSIALKRIKNQLNDIQKNPPLYWRVVVVNQTNWTVWMDADNFSPFYGITIRVDVAFPQNYPHTKPIIKFANPNLFFHANIDPTSGYICNSIVQNSDMTGIRDRIEALRTMLATPNYDSPLNGEAATMIKNDQKNNTTNWTKKALRIFRGWEKQ